MAQHVNLRETIVRNIPHDNPTESKDRVKGEDNTTYHRHSVYIKSHKRLVGPPDETTKYKIQISLTFSHVAYLTERLGKVSLR